MGIDRNLSWGQDKFLSMPMGSVRDQNCYKGFHFKEKVEKKQFVLGSTCEAQRAEILRQILRSGKGFLGRAPSPPAGASVNTVSSSGRVQSAAVTTNAFWMHKEPGKHVQWSQMSFSSRFSILFGGTLGSHWARLKNSDLDVYLTLFVIRAWLQYDADTQGNTMKLSHLSGWLTATWIVPMICHSVLHPFFIHSLICLIVPMICHSALHSFFHCLVVCWLKLC